MFGELSRKIEPVEMSATQYANITALIPVGNAIGMRHLKNNTRKYRAITMQWLDLLCNCGRTCSFTMQNDAI